MNSIETVQFSLAAHTHTTTRNTHATGAHARPLWRCHVVKEVVWRSPLPSITLSVTQSAFASTSDRPLCFPRACVGLIGPRPSDYPHALSACYYFLPAVFLLALGLWSSLPARQLSLDTSYSFLTFSVFFFFFFFF